MNPSYRRALIGQAEVARFATRPSSERLHLKMTSSQLWEDVRAIDTVVESVAVEFEGEDPLRPIMRGVLETTRQKLMALHEYMSIEEPLELPQPGEEVMELVQIYFRTRYGL